MIIILIVQFFVERVVVTTYRVVLPSFSTAGFAFETLFPLNFDATKPLQNLSHNQKDKQTRGVRAHIADEHLINEIRIMVVRLYMFTPQSYIQELEGAMVMLRAQTRRNRTEARAPFCTRAFCTWCACEIHIMKSKKKRAVVLVVSWGLGYSFQQRMNTHAMIYCPN